MKHRSRPHPKKKVSENHLANMLARRMTEKMHLRQLVRTEVAVALARMAAEQAALWEPCVGKKAQSDPKAKSTLGEHLASTLRALSIAYGRSDEPPSFSDFFPDEDT
jgi:hypothetical protein